MGFDVGAGLSLMGAAVSKTAGEYLLQNQKSELEKDSQKLAHTLAMERQTQQQGFQIGFEKDLKQPFEKEQEERRIAGQKDVANISGGYHFGASKYTADKGYESAKYRHDLDIAEKKREFNLLYGLDENGNPIEGGGAKERLIGKVNEGKLAVQEKRNEAIRERLAQTELPPDALQVQVDNYIETGKTPMIGRNPRIQAQIMAALPARLEERGLTLDKAREGWSTIEAQKKNLDNLTKVSGATSAFASTMDKNMKIVEEQFDKAAGPTGMPAIDYWVQKSRGAIGDPNVKALDQAIRTVLIEQAKLNTGQLGMAGLPEGARIEFNRLLSMADNKETIATMFKQFQADKVNRLNSLQEEITAATQGAATGRAVPLGSQPQATPATIGNPTGKAPPAPLSGDGRNWDKSKSKPNTEYDLGGTIIRTDKDNNPIWPK